MKLPLYLRLLLLLTLIGCAWLFWQDTSDTPAGVRPSTPVVTKPADPEPVPRSAVQEALARVDLFPAQTWAPPPAPIATPAPSAPPLPFTVSAQWRFERQAKIVVLSGNGRQYVLCNRCSVPGRIVPGKMLDGHYRLDTLTDTAVVLTYLPLRQVSTLRLDPH